MRIFRNVLSLLVTVALFNFTLTVSASADEEINLLPGGSIRNSDGLIGILGSPFNGGEWTYSAGMVNEEISGADADCQANWNSWALLCDPSPTTNQRGALTQYSRDVGYTSDMEDNSNNTVSFLVVDLGQISAFSSLEVYQMWNSDGEVTHVEMFVSPNLSDTWPVQSDPAWVSVAGGIADSAGLVALGESQSGTAPELTNTAATVFNFSEVTGRYVMFYFANDQRYTQGNYYIEVAGAKLFGSVVDAPVSPPPSAPVSSTTSTLATTGANVEWLMFAGLLAVIAGANFLTISRRKRTA
jgi:LPXTG-motif cell wall-anchored protein